MNSPTAINTTSVVPTLVSVPANETWQPAGLTAPENTSLIISYQNGLWSADPNVAPSRYDAGGNPDIQVPADQTSYPITGVNSGALVGRYGADGTPFLIGKGPFFIPSENVSELQLCINDDLTGQYGGGLADNVGELTLAVYEAIPVSDGEGGAIGQASAVAPTIVNYFKAIQQNAGTAPIPDIQAMLNGASQLDEVANPTDTLLVLKALSGGTANYNVQKPAPGQTLAFPEDHAMHLKMGTEWYWTASAFDVVDEFGNPGRISILACMYKLPAIGTPERATANWSDQQANIVCHTVTATIDMQDGDSKLVRRSRNLQWPLKGGITQFSSPGDPFLFRCGPDCLSGTTDVMPLDLTVEDADNMRFTISFDCLEGFHAEHAHFMQQQMSEGSGEDMPGFYYSWPQLSVTASKPLVLDGMQYTIVGAGTGWIDHQMLMSAALVASGNNYTGWVWQFFNSNRAGASDAYAFTGSGFFSQNTPPANGAALPMVAGYYLTPVPPPPGIANASYSWAATPITASDGIEITLLQNKHYPVIAGDTNPAIPKAEIPISRQYSNIEWPGSGNGGGAGTGSPLGSGTGSPWFTDGTFNNPDWSLCSELPADYGPADAAPTGFGYLESVGFENASTYRTFALAFLNQESELKNLDVEQLSALVYGCSG